jgi:AICAR transformylase/IMP cyclohydrolase PurH
LLFVESRCEWDNNDGISFESRKRLSQKVFSLMADYNKSIASYLNGDGDCHHPHLGS